MAYLNKLSSRLSLLRDLLILLVPVAVAVTCERPSVVGPAPHLAQITVLPESLALDPAQQTQFTAYGRSSNGDSVSVTVVWSASGGVIAPDGKYTAGVVSGDFLVHATSVQPTVSGSSRVHIRSPRAVASVVVSPATASVTVGQAVQLTATPQDASGSPLSGRVVTWGSSNTAVATVSGSGLVSGVAAGAATIMATSEGQSGGAAVTVVAGSVTGECATPKPSWIWCDDFEQDRLGQYFEYDDAVGGFVRAAGVGVGGSYGMRAHFGPGQVSAGSLHLAMGKVPSSYFRTVDAGTAIYRDVYWRMYLRNQAGWVGGGGYKLSRAISFAGSNWAEAMVAHLWGDPPATNVLLMDPVSGTDAAGNLLTTTYNDFAHFHWLGAFPGVTPLFDASHVGQWYCVEAHAQLNDAGLSNGVFEFWVNGNLDARETGLNWLGAYSAYGINAVFFENYWNTGSPAAQERYLDNIVVSTQRIGC